MKCHGGFQTLLRTLPKFVLLICILLYSHLGIFVFSPYFFRIKMLSMYQIDSLYAVFELAHWYI